MAQMIRFPIERVERDNCPRCGKLNGAFERMGSGVCNDCLSKKPRRKRVARRRKSA